MLSPSLITRRLVNPSPALPQFEWKLDHRQDAELAAARWVCWHFPAPCLTPASCQLRAPHCLNRRLGFLRLPTLGQVHSMMEAGARSQLAKGFASVTRRLR